MKRKRDVALCALLSLLFTAGCQRVPTTTRDGEAWSEKWTRVGTSLGVEPPENGLILLDNKDALAASGLYYATWVIGERADHVNADGETVDLYDAQLYLLLKDCKTPEVAMADVKDWRAREEKVYHGMETRTVTCAGQEFTVFLYTVDREDNPYARGATAFATWDTHAVSAELTCRNEFKGNLFDILIDFLNGFHYAL